jgi:hypothetical protein
MKARIVVAAPAVLMLTVLLSGPAHAYFGPGAGLSAIGSLLSLAGAFIFAVIGFIWYPFKRLLRKRNGRKQ